MKLLLTSGGLRNESIVGALKKLAGRPFMELSLAFVPTAANVEMGDKRWLIKDLEVLSKLGFKEIDIVDISAVPQKIWEKKLEKADVLVIEGGNSIHLMHWINKSSLGKILPQLLKKKVYVGISAGSIVLSPTLHLANDKKKELMLETGEKITEKGLGFINFYVKPHVAAKYLPERTFEFVEKLAKRVKQPVYALDDQSAVMVNGKQITVVSEGKWKKFN